MDVFLVSIIVRHTLSKHAYFKALSDKELQALVESSLARHFEVGQTIFHEGEPATGLWIIQEGRVKISRTNAEGNEYILHILGVGDTFNDIPALDAGDNAASAVALSDATVQVIPSALITQLIENNGQFALDVVRILTQRVRSLVGQIENLALYSVVVRLARFLLKQAEDPSLTGPGITRTAIAAHLATTPQTISVALRELEGTGAVQFDRHQIIIIDEEQLRTIAML